MLHSQLPCARRFASPFRRASLAICRGPSTDSGLRGSPSFTWAYCLRERVEVDTRTGKCLTNFCPPHSYAVRGTTRRVGYTISLSLVFVETAACALRLVRNIGFRGDLEHRGLCRRYAFASSEVNLPCQVQLNFQPEPSEHSALLPGLPKS